MKAGGEAQVATAAPTERVAGIPGTVEGTVDATGDLEHSSRLLGARRPLPRRNNESKYSMIICEWAVEAVGRDAR